MDGAGKGASHYRYFWYPETQGIGSNSESISEASSPENTDGRFGFNCFSVPCQVRACFPNVSVEPEGTAWAGYGFSIKFNVPDHMSTLRMAAFAVDRYRLRGLTEDAALEGLSKNLGLF